MCRSGALAAERGLLEYVDGDDDDDDVVVVPAFFFPLSFIEMLLALILVAMMTTGRNTLFFIYIEHHCDFFSKCNLHSQNSIFFQNDKAASDSYSNV